jgi:hypothetical protein
MRPRLPAASPPRAFPSPVHPHSLEWQEFFKARFPFFQHRPDERALLTLKLLGSHEVVQAPVLFLLLERE